VAAAVVVMVMAIAMVGLDFLLLPCLLCLFGFGGPTTRVYFACGARQTKDITDCSALLPPLT